HRVFEIVLAFAGVRRLFAAGAALAFRRLLDFVARHELLVSGEHEILFARRLGIEAEARLLRAFGGDADFPLLADVGDGGILQRLLHRFADLRARAAQEALAIGEALALGVEPAIYEIGHGVVPIDLTPPC